LSQTNPTIGNTTTKHQNEPSLNTTALSDALDTRRLKSTPSAKTADCAQVLNNEEYNTIPEEDREHIDEVVRPPTFNDLLR